MPIIGKQTLPVYGCYRCGYSWVPLGGLVRICPRCKSKLWDKPKLESAGNKGTGLGPGEIIGAKRERLLTILAKHHARAPRIFGSVARGQARRSSDLDLLVRFDEKATIFDRARLKRELERLLGRKVDIADERGLHWLARPQILHEAIPA